MKIHGRGLWAVDSVGFGAEDGEGPHPDLRHWVEGGAVL